MKLRTRLIIAFCTIFIAPIVLFTFIMIFYGTTQIKEMEETYGIDFSVSYITNPAQIIRESTQTVWEEINELAETAPDQLRDETTLRLINHRLRRMHAYLLLETWDEELLFQGETEKDPRVLLDSLPGYGEGEENGDPVYVGGPGRAVIRQQDVVFSDGARASLFIVAYLEDITPNVREISVLGGSGILFVLLLTAAGMTIWIYRGINVPIGRLKDAAHRISDGDLDFTLQAEGNDEISVLTRDFENMRRRLKESEEEKARYDNGHRELIRNISHDLRTPITSIKGYIEGIMDGVADTPEKMERYIRTVYNKANDMDRLINELTFYSNIDTNRIPYDFTLLDVNAFFGDCAEELSLELEETGISFFYDNEVPPGTKIVADPEQLKRVINNIISNAVKYMDKPQGKITLRIREAEGFIQTEIEDNGKGIDKKDLVSIFDRFYRSDEARSTSRGGSGIGLSIVRKIIEDHNGRIWAESTPGEGTTLIFIIRKYEENTK